MLSAGFSPRQVKSTWRTRGCKSRGGLGDQTMPPSESRSRRTGTLGPFSVGAGDLSCSAGPRETSRCGSVFLPNTSAYTLHTYNVYKRLCWAPFHHVTTIINLLNLQKRVKWVLLFSSPNRWGNRGTERERDRDARVSKSQSQDACLAGWYSPRWDDA